MPEVCAAGSGPQLPFRFRSGPFHRAAIQESFAALLHSTDPKQINAAVELYRQRFTSKGILENTVYPGIHAALTTLQERGALLFVATSKPRVFAERIVEHFGLKKHFCAVYGGELDGARSDKGDLIAYVLKADSLSPDSTVMVGDRAHDIMGAKAQGVFPVGVLWGYGSYDELIAAGATTLCEQPEMLDEILLSNSKLNPRSQGSASHCEHRNFIGGKNDK